MTHQYGDVAQLVRASSLYLEGHRFNSCRPYTGCVSWLGSSTTPGRRLTTHGPRKYYLSVAFRLFVRNKCPVGSLTLQVPLRGCGSDLVAQLVEQRPFKAWVVGSSPTGITRVRRIKAVVAQLEEQLICNQQVRRFDPCQRLLKTAPSFLSSVG